MDKNKLNDLRQQVPVGLQHGLTLLRQANGDIEEAVRLFQQEMLNLITDKTAVTADVALKHLKAVNYDVHLALESIDEERYTLTERIFMKNKDKENVLNLIRKNIEDEYGIKRNYWLEFTALNILPPEKYCLVVVNEWLMYYWHEGLDVAVYHHLDIVTEQIEKELLLNDIVSIMKKAREIDEKYEAPKRSKIRIGRGWGPGKPFRYQEILFREQLPILIDTLYDYVKKHINKFP